MTFDMHPKLSAKRVSNLGKYWEKIAKKFSGRSHLRC